MNILVKKGTLAHHAAEVALSFHFEEEKALAGISVSLDEAGGGLITEALSRGDFKGKHAETAVLYPVKPSGPKRIIMLGLGKKREFNLEKFRGAMARAAQQVRSLSVKQFAASVDLGEMPGQDYSPEAIVEAMVEAVVLGLYQFVIFKTVDQDNIKEVDEFVIVDDRDSVLKQLKKAAKTAGIIAAGVCYARDLVSHPANEMTPKDLAYEALNLGASLKGMNTVVLDSKEMQDMGMNALLGVARGSDEPPKFIIIDYRGGKRGELPIVLAGKGLTFDSGGISLKPAEKMDEMKSDMAGAAAVMAAIKVAAELALPLNLVALVPAVENLPSGKAYKPGDILKTLSGLTVEVVNTDAEGRLILADALYYAQRYKPAAIIDLATLTGACVVALGERVSGMMGNNDELKAKVRAAAEVTAEKVWELPLWEEYKEMIKSDVADYKNSGGRPAGAITAAALLSKFVGEIPWVHLDIAGPAWGAKDLPYIPKGASGVGVRLLVRLLRDWPAGKE